MTQSDQTPPPPQPTISQLEYGFTKNLGNYQAEQLAVRLDVPANSNPDLVLQDAHDWIEAHLSISEQELGDMRSKYYYWKREVARMESQTAELVSHYETLKTKLGSMGFVLPERVEDLPF